MKTLFFIYARSVPFPHQVKIFLLFFSAAFAQLSFGQGWSPIPPPSTFINQSIIGVHFTNSQTGYVCGANGNISKTIDCGTTWTNQISKTSSVLYSISFADANHGVAVGNGGVITVTNDGGQTWNLTTSIPASANVAVWRVVWFEGNSPIGYLGGGVQNSYATILKTTDYGVTWTDISPSQFGINGTGGDVVYGVHFTSPTDGWATDFKGRILKTTNSGSTWSFIQATTTNQLAGIYFTSPSTGYVVGGNFSNQTGVIFNITSANTISPIISAPFNTPAGHFLTGIKFFGTTGYAVGGNPSTNTNGVIYKYNGINWVELAFPDVPSTAFGRLYGISLPSSTFGYTCGLQGALLKTPLLDADFMFNSITGNCLGFQFNGSGSNTSSYSWDFGDPMSGSNNTSTQQSISHQFSKCGVFKVCLTASAGACNVTVCKDITIIDNTPPTIICPPNKVLTCGKDNVPAITGVATATDNCTAVADIGIAYTEQISGIADCDQSIKRTWTATDKCGNTSNCVQSIVIIDNIPPLITNCPQNTTVSTNQGQCSYTISTPWLISATDNCDPSPIVTLTYTSPSGATSATIPAVLPKGINTFVYQAKDKCKNLSKQCAFTITVVDTEKPTIICPQNVTVQGIQTPPPAICKATVNNIAPISFGDNCPMTTVAYTITGATVANGSNNASGTMFMQGISTVTYTITDMAGNTATCSFTVTVICNTCPNNLLTNGSFPTNISSWSQIYTPQYVSSDGAPGSLGAVQMWGNQVVGEGIEQAVNFQSGCTYDISFDAKYLAINALTLNPQIRLRATTASGVINFGNYNNPLATQIRTEPLTANWTTTNFLWTAPASPPLTRFVVTVWNNSSVSLPAQTSWLRADNFCIAKKSCPVAVKCGDFTHTGFGYERGLFKPVVCGSPNVIPLSCPNNGQRFYFSGAFACMGGNGTSAPITWQLWKNNVNTGISGSTIATPFFNIPLLPSYFPTGALYELRIVGYCGDKECPCIIKFEMPPCPDFCPCDNTFKIDVASGFYQVFQNKYCRKCFTPVALKECDKVEWSITPTDTSYVNPVTTTNGNQSFCFSFSTNGIYTITMKVTRLRPNGTTCMATFSKQIKVTCKTPIICDNKVFLNPTFNIEAKTGVLGSGGNSKDWLNVAGKPTMKDTSGSWLISLVGNEENSDAIRTNAEYCVQKDTGTVTLRAKLTGEQVRKAPMMFVNFVRGDKFSTASCPGNDCVEVACLQFPEDADEDWYDFEFDYDLRVFSAIDKCNNSTKPAIKMRPMIYVGNALHTEQGTVANTSSRIEIQKFCMKGDGTVPTKNVSETLSFRIFPNPNTGTFTVELPVLATDDTKLQITDLAGRVVTEKVTVSGLQQQQMEINNLPNGLYFLHVVTNGKTIAVEKFVKQ